jgi:hypothetical protein
MDTHQIQTGTSTLAELVQSPRRHDIRSDRGRSQGRERKGEHEPSCHHKYNPQTAPFLLAHLLIVVSLLALHVLCVRHRLAVLFFLVGLFGLRESVRPLRQIPGVKPLEIPAEPGKREGRRAVASDTSQLTQYSSQPAPGSVSDLRRSCSHSCMSCLA